MEKAGVKISKTDHVKAVNTDQNVAIKECFLKLLFRRACK